MPMYSLYTINYPKYWFVEDKKKEKYIHSFEEEKLSSEEIKKRESLLFHIKSGDYFGTIATITSLIGESLSQKEVSKEKSVLESSSLKNISRDLAFLQKKYKIVKK